MPIDLQAKMLRAIEEQKVTRVGEHKEISFNCRIISATNMNLQEAIKNNEFRLDLFHRLQTIEIKIPSLRERKEDIPILVDYFLESFSKKFKKEKLKISKDTLEHLKEYRFPGNVRELKNLIERAIIISNDNTIDNIIGMIDFSTAQNESENDDLYHNIEDNEKQNIISALKDCSGNQSKAAAKLGMNRNALIRRMKKYNIIA